MKMPIPNRTAAGQALAAALAAYRGRDDTIVLALPRGGVPVAVEVARSLDARLDLMIVRKLGAPGQPELARGAIASGGGRVMNEDIVRALGISAAAIERVADREQQELARREQAYRGDRSRPDLAGQCVILVDDGLATGATMRAAVGAVRSRHPARIVVAVPVAPPDTVDRLQAEADEVVCLEQPEPFRAIGLWYADFTQVSDDEVRQQLAAMWHADGGTGQPQALQAGEVT
ncbi:MAG: phosphoribosyltransferase, partial [Thiohalobacterales bacterium]|nr:phosphoribosyltransferase [Thiohalobacterales bacterium]